MIRIFLEGGALNPVKGFVDHRLPGIDEVVTVQKIEVEIRPPEGIAASIAAGYDETSQRDTVGLWAEGSDPVADIFLKVGLDAIQQQGHGRRGVLYPGEVIGTLNG